jgi:hypothetical protein
MKKKSAAKRVYNKVMGKKKPKSSTKIKQASRRGKARG